MMRSERMDRHGCVAIAVEVYFDEANQELHRSTHRSQMVCREAPIDLTACYCVIYAWHTYIDDA